MIIEGGSYSNGWWWAKHVQNKENNERIEVMEAEGLSGETIEEYFRQMYAVSKGTNCTNYFEQWNINLPKHEQLTDEQWQDAHEVARKNHGLEGQPFFRVRHTKREDDGQLHVHEHCFVLRIDIENMKAIPDSLTAQIREQTSRELEQKFGLTPVKSVLVPDREEPRPERRAKKYERFRGAKSGIDPHDLDKQLAAIKQHSDNGQSFKAGLEAEGLLLVKGDRRDFLIIDQAGDEHSLARRLHMKTAELRAFMADVDREALPTVDQGRFRQMERAAARDFAEREKGGIDTVAPRPSHMRTDGPENGPTVDLNGQAAETPASKQQSTTGNMRGAWQAAHDAGDLVAELEARNIRLAVVTALDVEDNRQQRAAAKEIGRYAGPVLKEGQIVAVDHRGYTYTFTKRTTGAERGEIAERLAGVDSGFLPNVKAAQQEQRESTRAAWIENKRTEWEQARPANWIETKILDLERQARTIGAVVQRDKDGALVSGIEAVADRLKPQEERQTESTRIEGPQAFAVLLDQAGISLCRVTAADVQTLDQLRRDEEQAREVSRTNGTAHEGNAIAEVQEGDLAAVTRSGDVFRLNTFRLEGIIPPAAEAPAAISSTVPASEQPSLPGVIEARAAWQEQQTEADQFWKQWQAEATAERAANAASREGDREFRHFVRQIERAATLPIAAGGKAVEAISDVAHRVVDALSKPIEGIISALDGLMSSPAAPTELEREVAPKVAEERAHVRDWTAYAAAQEEAREWQAESLRKSQQESDLRLSQTLGTNATREANLGRDEYDKDRSRER